ncbi:MAG: cytochrome c biogenesis protein CcsA [Alphaproteobacteria bacterium]|nr:cytochrome c biogenesis protein CcsA [Alphaproteobacteria bacterium]
MRQIIALLLFLLCAALSAGAHAQDPLDMSGFQTLPVLHEGRVKPLDSFARIHLKQISGHEHGADRWLAKTLFDPAAAAEDKIFLVRDPDLKRQLGLKSDARHFSFNEVQAGLEGARETLTALFEQDPASLTAQQSALIELQKNAMMFAQIMRSFSLFLPLNIALPEAYQKAFEGRAVTYLNLRADEPDILAAVTKLAQTKGQNLSAYSEDETKLAQLSLSLKLFQLAGENNRLFKIVPGAWGAQSEEWYAPWQLILDGQGSPQGKAYLQLWENMAAAYRDHDAKLWESACAEALQSIAPHISAPSLTLETLYNMVKPFHVALALYALSFVLLLTSLRATQPVIKGAAITTLSAGALTHLIGVIARVGLLDRPPVGTLYESVIFVALLCALFGLFMYARSKNIAPALAGAFSAGGMLIIAPFLITQGESMEMLVAVLNTNFWLSTHVLCITTGYAVSVFAACIAHAYLWGRAQHADAKTLEGLKSALYKISLFALLFTAVGTALGGIWADQSWGRFWGWDPKENGALLIVLWLIWAHHGRISGKLSEIGFAASMAWLNVIVALAWFGVNLLSVGLHSYGFIDGIAYALGLFVLVETCIIGGLWALTKKRTKHHAA